MVAMYDQAKLAQLAESRDRWEETTLHQTLARAPERREVQEPRRSAAGDS